MSLCHPWESGGDDSPRWDHWCPGGWEVTRWYEAKGALVRSIVEAPDGSPVSNPDFRVAAAGFNALVAFNALELADVTEDGALAEQAETLVSALDDRWDASLATWVDAGDSEATSGRVRTLDALLPALVSRRTERVETAFVQMLDDRAFGGTYGPAQVHRSEPSFAARTYWRGPAWPQLTYLCQVAATRAGRAGDAASLGRMLLAGAVGSGWAEYWDADDANRARGGTAVLGDARRARCGDAGRRQDAWSYCFRSGRSSRVPVIRTSPVRSRVRAR